MTTEELLNAIRKGKAHIDWAHVTSEAGGHKLRLTVMADAIRFDNCPPMNWARTPKPAEAGEPTSYDGVRLPVTAREMQQVADLLGCMLMTPKVLDLVWQQAERRFDPVVNVNGQIVALCDIHDVHTAVEAKVTKAGGDPKSLVASVAKYWVLSNRLLGGKFGVHQAVNYGWHASNATLAAVTPGLKVYQNVGAAHDSSHIDPSQGIRLMYRWAWLMRAGSSTWEQVDLHMVATDPSLAPLISHEGVLKVLRMQDVPEPQAVRQDDGTVLLPEVYIVGDPSPEPDAIV